MIQAQAFGGGYCACLAFIPAYATTGRTVACIAHTSIISDQPIRSKNELVRLLVPIPLPQEAPAR